MGTGGGGLEAGGGGTAMPGDTEVVVVYGGWGSGEDGQLHRGKRSAAV